MIRQTALLALLASVSFIGVAEARDQIRIVGSSTVFPFATRVGEEFGRTTNFKSPVVESTGTGGGLKLFCSGVGVDTADIANASRPIKKSEVDMCKDNGVTSITEVKIGYDGIILAHSKKGAPIDLTLKDLYLALAKDVPDGKGGFMPNPNKTWNEINPAFPKAKIEVLGPPPTSGTRDAFVELAMAGGCKQIPELKELEKTDDKKFKAVCESVREDGVYVDAGENDVLIVRKLEANPNAYGIFGYSYLEQNMDKIVGMKVGGVEPTYENIAENKYPISRSLFFYVKDAHATVIPGIKEFVSEFTSDKAWGPDGYLATKGLIAMPDAERARMRKEALELSNNVHM